MSRTLIIFAHPSHDSYNFGLLQKVVAGLSEGGHEFRVNDLCAMNFDPVLTEDEFYRRRTPDIVREEQEKVIWANTLFFIFPVWWWSPPAVLKGWLERVMCQDFAFRYDIKSNGLVGNLQGRKAVIIITSTTDPESYSIRWQAGSHTDFVKDILVMSGVSVVRQMNFHSIHKYSDQNELRRHLQDTYELAKNL